MYAGMTARTRRTRVNVSLQKQFRGGRFDAAILSLVLQYRYIRGTHIYQHIGYKHRETVKKRLRFFSRSGIISKVGNSPFGDDLKRDNNNFFSDLYACSKYTRDFLNRVGGEIPPEVTFLRGAGELTSDDQDSSRLLIKPEKRHSMMISDAMSNIVLSHKKLGLGFVPQGMIRAGESRDANRSFALPVNTSFRSQRGTLEKLTGYFTPDCLWITKYAPRKSQMYILEAERTSKSTRRSVLSSGLTKKVVCYASFSDQHGADIHKHLGRSAFSSVFLYPTYSQAQRASESALILLRHMKRLDKCPMFLFGVQPTHEVSGRSVPPSSDFLEQLFLRPGLAATTISHPL